MKKYVVLGINDNLKYVYYLPLVNWAWRKIGWHVILFQVGDLSMFDDVLVKANKFNDLRWRLAPIDDVDGYKSETVAQVSRLYGASIVNDGYLMTSDVDMLPLSDYWFANIELIDCYGRDLTDYHYPMCYIGAEVYLWRKLMAIPDKSDRNELIKRDLRHQKNEWVLDQDLVTERLKFFNHSKINRIDRGTDPRTGYPIGRVDRSNWRLDHAQLIDAHLPHDILTNDASYKKVMELLRHVWPNESFEWFISYHHEFKKLI